MSFEQPTPGEKQYNSKNYIAYTGEDQRVFDDAEFQKIVKNNNRLCPFEKIEDIRGNILNYRPFWESAFYILENYLDQKNLMDVYRMTVNEMQQFMNTDEEEKTAYYQGDNRELEITMNKRTVAEFMQYVELGYYFNKAIGITIKPKPKLYAAEPIFLDE